MADKVKKNKTSDSADNHKNCHYCGKGFVPPPNAFGPEETFCSPICYETFSVERESER